MKVKKRSLIASVLLLGGALISFLVGCIHLTGLEKTLMQIGVMALISMAFTVGSVFYATPARNAFLYFIILSYFFSFGQCIIALFGYKSSAKIFNVANGFFSAEEYLNSAKFSVVAITFVALGYLLTPLSKKQKQIVIAEEAGALKGKEKALCIAWVLLLVSFIPKFYVLIEEMLQISLTGYASTLVKKTGISRIFYIISGLFSSSLVLIYALEEKKWRRYLMFAIIIADFAIQLAGGSRIEIFRMILIMLVISDLYRKELTRKRWIIVILLGLVFSFIFPLVSNVRNYLSFSDDIPNLLKNSAEGLVQKNFIFESIREMGHTQILNTLVYTNCPSRVDFHYGFSFVQILWGIFPNFIGEAYTGANGVDIVFSPLYSIVDCGLGASFISEGYWNFGYFAVVYYFLFGSLWAYLCNEFDTFCRGRRENAIKLWIVLYVIYFMFFMVRSESIGFGRSFVYYALFPCLLCKITLGKRSDQIK